MRVLYSFNVWKSRISLFSQQFTLNSASFKHWLDRVVRAEVWIKWPMAVWSNMRTFARLKHHVERITSPLEELDELFVKSRRFVQDCQCFGNSGQCDRFGWTVRPIRPVGHRRAFTPHISFKPFFAPSDSKNVREEHEPRRKIPRVVFSSLEIVHDRNSFGI